MFFASSHVRYRRSAMLVGLTRANIVYSIFTGGSRGGCRGGVTEAGLLDENGAPTDIAPTCVQMTLEPGAIVCFAFAAVVFLAIGRVLGRADSEASAVLTLDRAAIGIVVIAVASVIISRVWFGMIPLDGIDGAGKYVWPFPFASVDLQIGPMTGP